MKKTSKILFIGNSHTFFNDLPYMFKYLCENGPLQLSVDVVMIAHGGKSLEFHKNEPEVRFNIRYGGYDYVVLQQAAHPFPDKDLLLRDGKELCKQIFAAGSTPVLYMTWAEKAMPQNQRAMEDAYTELAQEVNGILCPVGLAWEKVIAADPGVELFDLDCEHASFAGHYLTACVFYATLTGKSPVGLPYSVNYRDEVLGRVSIEQGQLFQNIAGEFINRELKNTNK